jgi:hypothetical protein
MQDQQFAMDQQAMQMDQQNQQVAQQEVDQKGAVQETAGLFKDPTVKKPKPKPNFGGKVAATGTTLEDLAVEVARLVGTDG